MLLTVLGILSLTLIMIQFVLARKGKRKAVMIFGILIILLCFIRITLVTALESILILSLSTVQGAIIGQLLKDES